MNLVETHELNGIIQEAWNWLMNEHNLNWKREDFDLHFNFVMEDTARRARLNIQLHKDGCHKYNFRIVRDRTVWHTYELKEVGRWADMIECSNRFAILIQLIHEMSHLIEYRLTGDSDERLPVANELKFARQNYPEYWNQTLRVHPEFEIKS